MNNTTVKSIMTNTTRILTLALSLLASPVFAGSGDELFEKVRAKYSSCESFTCEGKSTTTSGQPGEGDPYRCERKFNIAFRRPDLLRVDWIEPSMPSLSPVTCSLYTDNGKYYGVNSAQRTPEEFPSVEMGMGSYTGISGGITAFLPSLLFGQAWHFIDFSCEMLADLNYEGQGCSVIEINDKNSGKWTLTVDKESFGILHVQQIQTITAKQSAAAMEVAKKTLEALKAVEGMNIPLPQPAVSDTALDIVTTYRNVEFDKNIAVSEFVFAEKIQ